MPKHKERIAAWISRVFGIQMLLDRRERATRLLEEALELAQAEGVLLLTAVRVAQRVYQRPPGRPGQEVSGVRLTLLAYCSAAGIDEIQETELEIGRLERLPVDYLRQCHQAKVDAGLALGLDNG